MKFHLALVFSLVSILTACEVTQTVNNKPDSVGHSKDVGIIVESKAPVLTKIDARVPNSGGEELYLDIQGENFGGTNWNAKLEGNGHVISLVTSSVSPSAARLVVSAGAALVEGTYNLIVSNAYGQSSGVVSALKGDKGEAGLPGAPGVPGIKGDTGAQGSKGDKGDAGAQGFKGDKGERGDAGPQGIQGNSGAVGAKGDKGDRGETGARGAMGIANVELQWNSLVEKFKFTLDAATSKLSFSIPQGMRIHTGRFQYTTFVSGGFQSVTPSSTWFVKAPMPIFQSNIDSMKLRINSNLYPEHCNYFARYNSRTIDGETTYHLTYLPATEIVGDGVLEQVEFTRTITNSGGVTLTMKQFWVQSSQWLYVQCVGGVFDGEVGACKSADSQSYLYVLKSIYADCSRPVAYQVPGI